MSALSEAIKAYCVPCDTPADYDPLAEHKGECATCEKRALCEALEEYEDASNEVEADDSHDCD